MFQPDVIVVGGGLIGLSCATSVARDGLRVLIATSNEAGAASPASAGILAPSVGTSPEGARALAIASRDMYPLFVEALASRTGVQVPLDRSGVLEVIPFDGEAEPHGSTRGRGGEWLDAKALRALEPSLAPAIGAVFHCDDGSVDSSVLLSAVRAEAERDRRIAFHAARVVRIEPDRAQLGIQLADGHRLAAPAVVLAAGAWASTIEGLPRPLPIAPVRGQILALAGAPLRHVVMGPRGYVVSRGGRVLVGSTMEHVGFDARPTAGGAALLRTYAEEMLPGLGACPVLEHRAGLRPITPDLLPILGADPECSGLFYACGHSRNGVLLAPLTARVIGDLISGRSLGVDISPYAPARFGR